MFHTEKREKILFEIIADLLRQIDRLIFCRCHAHGRARSLGAIYYTVSDSGDIIINDLNKHKMAKKKALALLQTITVLFGQNTVPGQLVPLADDGVTVEPIDTIQTRTEVYTSSDPSVATVAADTSGVEGAFVVQRVSGAAGPVTISYKATNAQGVTIQGQDNFIFLGAPTGIAASLTATYGQPV